MTSGRRAAHRLVVEAPAAQDAAAVVLGDDVGRGAQRQRQLAGARLAHVEADAALAARRVVEREGAVRRVGLDGDGAQQVEVGARLDADHVGAELGEQHAELGRRPPHSRR